MAMSPEQRQPLQDTVLRHLREHKVPVTVFLTNGVRLQGHVGAFDVYSVLLVRDRQAQVVVGRLQARDRDHPAQRARADRAVRRARALSGLIRSDHTGAGVSVDCGTIAIAVC